MDGVIRVPTLFVGIHWVLGKLAHAKLAPLIHHYFLHTLTQGLSTVDQVMGISIGPIRTATYRK
jgi:hypothetical protein